MGGPVPCAQTFSNSVEVYKEASAILSKTQLTVHSVDIIRLMIGWLKIPRICEENIQSRVLIRNGTEIFSSQLITRSVNMVSPMTLLVEMIDSTILNRKRLLIKSNANIYIMITVKKNPETDITMTSWQANILRSTDPLLLDAKYRSPSNIIIITRIIQCVYAIYTIIL